MGVAAGLGLPAGIVLKVVQRVAKRTAGRGRSTHWALTADSDWCSVLAFRIYAQTLQMNSDCASHSRSSSISSRHSCSGSAAHNDAHDEADKKKMKKRKKKKYRPVMDNKCVLPKGNSLSCPQPAAFTIAIDMSLVLGFAEL